MWLLLELSAPLGEAHRVEFAWIGKELRVEVELSRVIDSVGIWLGLAYILKSDKVQTAGFMLKSSRRETTWQAKCRPPTRLTYCLG